MNALSGISAGGNFRLLEAVREQVRREFAVELAGADKPQARAAIEKKIKAEVGRRMKEMASKQSLWGAA